MSSLCQQRLNGHVACYQPCGSPQSVVLQSQQWPQARGGGHWLNLHLMKALCMQCLIHRRSITLNF